MAAGRPGHRLTRFVIRVAHKAKLKQYFDIGRAVYLSAPFLFQITDNSLNFLLRSMAVDLTHPLF